MSMYTNCPCCGEELSATFICMNLKCEVAGYSFGEDNDLGTQVTNNFWTVDKSVGGLHLNCKPSFYILGGVALYMHDLNYKFTVDIDTANSIDALVKDNIDGLVDDAASEVAILPVNYKSRAVRVLNYLKYIEVYILSKEDLFISKIGAARKKDIKSIIDSGLMTELEYSDILELIKAELPAKYIMHTLPMLYKLKQEGYFDK